MFELQVIVIVLLFFQQGEPLTVEPQLQIKLKQCSSNKKLTANLTQQLVPTVEGN